MVLDDCDSPLGRAGGLAVYPLATLWLLVGMAAADATVLLLPAAPPGSRASAFL